MPKIVVQTTEELCVKQKHPQTFVGLKVDGYKAQWMDIRTRYGQFTNKMVMVINGYKTP